MSTAGKQKATARETKRARFAEQQARSGGASPWVLIAGLAIVVALVGGAVVAFARPDTTPEVAPASAADSGVDAEPVSAGPGTDSTIGEAVVYGPPATSGHEPYPLVQAEDGAVRLDVATFDDYKAHYYTYMHDGRPIEFFVLKSKDGVVRAAFNACDVCFAAKKGYSQAGDYMVCNNCGQRFPADKINEVRGGCNPSPLDRSVEGDTLVILVEDLVQGQIYF
ncbi:MAG TPA: DUF2318 domain-containing protein [Anaerolineae bacterium]|nr:DUF2318 domain-containing protein [Anaerolineae bacterium]